MHYTHLEDYIYDLYKSLSITEPNQLIKEDIAEKLKLDISYQRSGFRFNGNITLIKSTKQKEWQMFAHELCHKLAHVGNQLNMHYLFRDLQECQANYFSYHFCVPTFMLQNLKEVTVYDIMDLFNVEYDFALRRFEMYQSKLLERKIII